MQQAEGFREITASALAISVLFFTISSTSCLLDFLPETEHEVTAKI